jgi:hypothetical protein
VPGVSDVGWFRTLLAWIRLRARLIVASAALIVVVAAIGGGAVADAARPPADTEQFLCEDAGFVAFVEFVPDGGRLSGTLEVSSLAPGATVSANYEYLFTGTLRASRIRIELASIDPAGSSTLTGWMRGGDLVLRLWREAGAPVSRTLVPSSPVAYQAALARVNELASANAERSLYADQVDDAARILNAAYETVIGDQSLVSGYDVPFGADLARAEADYEQTLTDAQVAEQGSRATCPGLAAVVVQDQSDVLSDEYVLEGDQETLSADLVSARNDISALRTAESGYGQALARDPGHRDAVPTPAQVVAAEQGLAGQMTASTQTMQGYVAEAEGYAQQAKYLAQAASQACG